MYVLYINKENKTKQFGKEAASTLRKKCLITVRKISCVTLKKFKAKDISSKDCLNKQVLCCMKMFLELMPPIFFIETYIAYLQNFMPTQQIC